MEPFILWRVTQQDLDLVSQESKLKRGLDGIRYFCQFNLLRKKMNFTTDLPKKNPLVTYIVASAVKCEKFFPKNES